MLVRVSKNFPDDLLLTLNLTPSDCTFYINSELSAVMDAKDSAMLVGAVLEHVHAIHPEWAHLDLKQLIDLMNDLASVSQPEVLARQAREAQSAFLPPNHWNVNGPHYPFVYQEQQPQVAKRANFAECTPHKKPSALRGWPPIDHIAKPERSYDSFDSLSVVDEVIPKDPSHLSNPGIGKAGDSETLDPNLQGSSTPFY